MSSLEEYYQEYHQLPEAYTIVTKPLYYKYIRDGIPLTSSIAFFFNYYEAEEYVREHQPRSRHELIIAEFHLGDAFAYCPDAIVVHSDAHYTCRELREGNYRNFNGAACFVPKSSWYLSRHCVRNARVLPGTLIVPVARCSFFDLCLPLRPTNRNPYSRMPQSRQE